MKTVTLSGAWSLTQAGEAEVLPAQVPGCVHMDLLRSERLSDPFFRDQEAQQFWIGETDWTYERTFEVTPDILAHDRVLLRCHGLDTLATITVNGHEVARTDNMFRTYEFDVQAHLVVGKNHIAIHFAAPMPYLRQQEDEKGVMYAWSIGTHRINSGAWLRKEPCNFGWDWGPILVTSGIWRDIELVAYNTARLTDALIVQEHGVDPNADAVQLSLRLSAEQIAPSPVTATVTVTREGDTVATSVPVTLDADQTVVEVLIEQPELWWPNGMGDQPLYTVTVELHNAEGQVVDTVTKRIGLRTLVLDRHADEWGETFQFVVNGVPFFAKGANWIPADTFAPRLTSANYKDLIVSTADAHMNMLRVWGGGIYEADVFYELCDEYGICVWQDFMFACGLYPAHDAEFMANVVEEAADNVQRIRHHACMALWCGNNELEQGLVGNEWTAFTMSWKDYGKLFDTLLRDVVAKHDPQRDYWPGSPHSPCGDRSYWLNPACGDTHLWQVWHGKEPLEWYRTAGHRFVSEFGMQSFPEPRTTYTYTLPEDRNITSYVMEYHQRSGIGNSTIIHYMLDWFRLPTSFEALLWLSQMLQGLAIKIAVEHWRRSMPQNMGALYWQLNDCWPGPSWSSIDHVGRWKALQYMARRFFAPVLVTGVEDTEQHTVALHVTSDLADAVEGTLRWTLTTVDGTRIAGDDIPVTVAPRQNTAIDTLDLSAHVAEHTARNLLLWLELHPDAGVVSGNLVLLVRPKHLALPQPAIQVTTRAVNAHTVDVTLESDVPALYVWLELPDEAARYDDGFFHLYPGQPKTVQITSPVPLDADAVQDTLRVQSLVDTYHRAE